LQRRKSNEATTARALETIARNARLQTQLIENLLDISHLLRGKLLLNKHPVELKSVIEAAIQTVQPEANAKMIRLNSHLDDVVEPVLGDGDRLRQVMENLLSNAIKFTPEGGKVEVQVQQQHGEARIQVSDTGQGIQAEVLPFIFDYFRQADSSTTRRHGGLGIGLAIVRQLVELHDGDIHVESPGEGLGATFTVILPLLTTSTRPVSFR
jgi:signal transduction histidine kinase